MLNLVMNVFLFGSACYLIGFICDFLIYFEQMKPFPDENKYRIGFLFYVLGSICLLVSVFLVVVGFIMEIFNYVF